jgi:hypothetical protein
VCVELIDLLYTRGEHNYFRESIEKHRFKDMVRTIQSPTLKAVTVCVTTKYLFGEEETLPRYDWTDVDMLFCDLLTRMRMQYPSWTFWVRLTACPVRICDGSIPEESRQLLPGFRAMGGELVHFSHKDGWKDSVFA